MKEVEKLTGSLAALNRFISRMGDKCKPMFDTLRKRSRFEWMEKSQEAFDKIKEYLANVRILSKPVPGEKLFLYLATSDTVLSLVLVRAEG